MDEPTAGLDPEERVRFRNLLSDLSGERIVILSTHIVSDVEAVATDLAVVVRGRLVRQAAPEAFLQASAGQVWEWLIASDELPGIRNRFRITGTIRRPEGMLVRVLAATSPGAGARPVEPTLEDAYLDAVTAPAAGNP